MTDRKSALEELKDKLYSRTKGTIFSRQRRELKEHYYDAPEKWNKSDTSPMAINKKEKRSLLHTLLIAAIIFFVGSLAVSGYFFFAGSNVVSAENIDIDISGPTAVGGGEELSLQISIHNRNPIPVKLVDMMVEFPEGTRSATDLNTELPRLRESLGEIGSGERVNRTVKAVLFGEENTSQQMVVAIEYRIDGSNAIFFKEKVYEVVLSSSPLSVLVEGVERVPSGQETEFTVTVASNSSTVIENALLKAEYPFGFTFLSGSPQPQFDTTIWELGDIAPGGKRTITIRGILAGEDGQERIFRFLGGLESETADMELSAIFASVAKSIVIERPFLSVDLLVDGERAAELVSESGKTIRVDVTWKNNLPTQVFDGEIVLNLSGDALSKSSVSVERGFYQSANNTILWNRETNPELATIEPGETGRASFTFSTFDSGSAPSMRNPAIALEVDVSGKRVSDAQVPEAIAGSDTAFVKLSSDLFLVSRALHFSGPFQNSGPMPPRAETETTYTVVWAVTNSFNRVSGAQVEATLPSYVEWKGAGGSSEDISFNPVGGKVIWNLGVLQAGESKEIAFQIGFTPSISQVGATPVLISGQKISGFDDFTGTALGSTRAPLSIELSTDPNFALGHGTVVE